MTLFVRTGAEADLAAARDWYERPRVDLGYEFLNEVARALNELAQSRERSRPYYRNFRRVLLRRFPYKIFDAFRG